jgi:hypothetical protein
VAEHGDRRAAESELLERRERREKVDVAPLEPAARERYAERWRATQRRFVDEPAPAVAEADEPIKAVMRDRGDPVEDDFERRAADISVDHPTVVEHYRTAHAISTESARGGAGRRTCVRRWCASARCSRTSSAMTKPIRRRAPRRQGDELMERDEEATSTREDATEHPRQEATETHDGGGPLFPSNESGEFGRRWEEIQTTFVDEPQRAVEEADALVASVIERLAEGFARERERLEGHWSRGEDVSTEDPRVTLQRYRSFFRRLLSA